MCLPGQRFIRVQFPWKCFVRKTKRVCLAHLYPSAVMNTKCDFNCFNIVEVVRSARVLQKYLVTMATLGGAQSQRVFFITTLIDRYRYQI